jgi:PAS domain S-box-containing protein
MAQEHQHDGKTANLRQQAESILRGRAVQLEDYTVEDAYKLIYELQVYQIELDLQTEELRRVQDEIKLARDQYIDLYDFAPIGYLSLDHLGRIQQINLTGAAMFGVERGNLINQAFSDLVFDEDQDTYYLHLKKFLNTSETAFAELRLLKTGGTSFDAHVESTAITDEEGHFTQCRMVISDVTDRNQAERRRFAFELEQERSKLLIAFIEGALHEFRTPLSTILMELSALSKGLTDLTQEQTVQRINDQTETIAALVSNIAALSELDGGEEFPFTALGINHLIDSVLTAEQTSIQHQHLNIVLELDEALPLIDGNREKLQQALRAMLDNAIRFTPSEGTITFCTYMIDDHVCIEIRDTGVGIAGENLVHIFERFWRHDKPHSTRGFGLGLPLAKRIVEGHQGHIEVESMVGGGSTFRIMLPQQSTSK